MIQNVRQVGGATVVEIGGRLDASTSAAEKVELQKIIADGDCKLVLNLRNLEFIDSSGLGVLVGCLRRCVALGGDVCLTEIPQLIRTVFELTRLTRVFQVAASESEATEMLNQGTAG